MAGCRVCSVALIASHLSCVSSIPNKKGGTIISTIAKQLKRSTLANTTSGIFVFPISSWQMAEHDAYTVQYVCEECTISHAVCYSSSTLTCIMHACRNIYPIHYMVSLHSTPNQIKITLTCRFYKLMVLLNWEEWLSQVPEVLLQDTGNGCNICLLCGKVRA